MSNMDNITMYAKRMIAFQNVGLEYFKKDNYEEKFKEFCELSEPFFKEFDQLVSIASELESTKDETISQICFQISSLFVQNAKDLVSLEKNKYNKENCQINSNMFMVTYVLPSMLDQKSKDTQKLAQAIEENWATNFKNSNIKAATFESIKGGFKTKLCYITTAVCNTLQKDQDCYEINLLKEYRDQYLFFADQGEAVIHDYYDIAPTIIKRINKSADSERVYHTIWTTYLEPCIQCIEQNKKEECRDIYTQMVQNLYKEYMEGNYES